MAFAPDILERELRSSRFGRACRAVAEAPSTIELAWAWLHAGGPEGGVVIADRQTQGRGRLGRAWTSPEGGLWCSVIARPEILAAEAGRLGIWMALAGAAAVAEVAGVKPGLRWPNDILIGKRKVGGVLVETQIKAERVAAAVLSVGLNVNLFVHDLPREVQESATSVREATGRSHPLEAVAARVLESLESLRPGVTGRGTELVERWRHWDALLGTEVLVAVGERTLQGSVQGIASNGALLLVTDGRTTRVAAGEVTKVTVGAR